MKHRRPNLSCKYTNTSFHIQQGCISTYIDCDTCAGDVERSIDCRNIQPVEQTPYWEVNHHSVLNKEKEY